MSHLMALLEATKITLDNREELVVDLSQEMVEKDLQVEQLSTDIQELEELVGTRENTIEVLEDQLINTQQQLAEANKHLDMHHQEIKDQEANEDVDIEGGDEPASSVDTAGSGRPPSPGTKCNRERLVPLQKSVTKASKRVLTLPSRLGGYCRGP
jgi:chromosome segregation ATPase